MASSGSSRRKPAGSRTKASQTKGANTNTTEEPNTNTGSDDSNGANGSPGANGTKSEDPLRAALLGLSKLAGDDGTANPVTDAITQAVLLLLGTGPAVAAYQGLLSTQQANSEMFNQAVSNQQRLNLLGMCTTAKCVRYMFDGDEEEITDVEDMLGGAAKG